MALAMNVEKRRAKSIPRAGETYVLITNWRMGCYTTFFSWVDSLLYQA